MPDVNLKYRQSALERNAEKNEDNGESQPDQSAVLRRNRSSIGGLPTREFLKMIAALPVINRKRVKSLRRLLAKGKVAFDEDEVARKFMRLEGLLKY